MKPKCKKCGKHLIGLETKGEVCNKCLDKAVEKIKVLNIYETAARGGY